MLFLQTDILSCYFRLCTGFWCTSNTIPMYRKIDKTVHLSCASIPFCGYRTEITRNPSTPFERALNSGLETKL